MNKSGQNGQQQYLLALVECLIDVRLGKKPFCTYKAPSCVKLLEIKLVGYVYFRIK